MKAAILRVALPLCILALAMGCGEDGGSGGDTSTPLDLTGMMEGNSGGDGMTNMGQGGEPGMGDVTNGGDGTSGSGSNGMGGGSPMTPPANDANCTQSGFSAGEELAGPTSFGVQYQAVTNSMPQNVMMTQIYSSFDGPTEPGRYDLAGINYADCGLCLLMLVNCTGGGNCEKTLYADEGTVEITKLDSGEFAARYENVVYREVTISEGDSRSTPVDGGMTWCADGYSFDQQLQEGSSGGSGAPNEEQICAGSTACVGEQIANFQLTSCETGERVGIRDYLAGAEMGVLLATAGWCGACSARIPQVTRFAEQNPNVRPAFILGETSTQGRPPNVDPRSVPDVRYCTQYARSKGIPIENIFIDHDGTYSHSTLFQNMYPYPQDGFIGLPYHAAVDPATGEYVYGDGGPAGIPDSLRGLW